MSGLAIFAIIALAGVLAFGGSFGLSAIFGERRKRRWEK